MVHIVGQWSHIVGQWSCSMTMIQISVDDNRKVCRDLKWGSYLAVAKPREGEEWRPPLPSPGNTTGELGSPLPSRLAGKNGGLHPLFLLGSRLLFFFFFFFFINPGQNNVVLGLVKKIKNSNTKRHGFVYLNLKKNIL